MTTAKITLNGGICRCTQKTFLHFYDCYKCAHKFPLFPNPGWKLPSNSFLFYPSHMWYNTLTTGNVKALLAGEKSLHCSLQYENHTRTPVVLWPWHPILPASLPGYICRSFSTTLPSANWLFLHATVYLPFWGYTKSSILSAPNLQ